ncbi:MAG TPA: 1,4-alpha-glucan branching enzyme, partial [Brachybacterium paraconglomeratum]|nr:1,4-alpha-glucan branching enzyme [Brachybacterium paraconglomeratum]
MSHTTESADRPVPVMPLGEHELGATATGSHHEPHAVLGAHEYEGGVTVRTLKPFASEVAVLLPDGSAHGMEHEHDGIWTVALPLAEVPSYRIRVTWSAGENWV